MYREHVMVDNNTNELLNSEQFRRRTTVDYVERLEPGEVFVFGSNPLGWHGGGAAAMAHMFFGAVWGQGTGLQGQSYAIPTVNVAFEKIGSYVDEFLVFAKEHPELRFLVTGIGCGVAGYSPEEIAPLFHDAIGLENVSLPESFWRVLFSDVDEQ